MTIERLIIIFEMYRLLKGVSPDPKQGLVAERSQNGLNLNLSKKRSARVIAKAF